MQTKKYHGGNRGIEKNKNGDFGGSLAKRVRLTQSLKDAFNAEMIPALWMAEIAKIGGCHV